MKSGEKPGNSSIRDWLLFIAIIAIVAAAPAVVRQDSKSAAFDAKPLEELKAQAPDYIFIGNSMLETRIVPARLEELLGGRKVYMLSDPGSMSAVWYLMLKNYVVESGVKPDAVFIFFRTTVLTEPLRRTHGRYRKRIDRMSRADNTEFWAVMNENENFSDRVGNVVTEMYPVVGIRNKIDRNISGMAMIPVLPGELGFLKTRIVSRLKRDRAILKTINVSERMKARDALLQDVNDMFVYDNLKKSGRGDLEESESAEAYDFAKSVDRSFLPLVMKEARENGLKLVFVRVQRRPSADGSVRESPELVQYTKDLKEYVEDGGMIFHDFTGDPGITLEMYREGDHIAEEYMGYYTELFRDRLREVFK